MYQTIIILQLLTFVALGFVGSVASHNGELLERLEKTVSVCGR